MRIWEYTLEELTGGKEPLGDQDGEMGPQPFVRESIVPIADNPRYAMAFIRGGGSLANQALVELVEGEWRCVGSYVDDTIHIEPSARKQGVAEELVLRCAEHRDQLPFTANFTKKGYSLLKRTHRLAVERAVKGRLLVPEKVLK